MCLDDRRLGRNRTFLKRLFPEVAQQAKHSGFSWPQAASPPTHGHKSEILYVLYVETMWAEKN